MSGACPLTSSVDAYILNTFVYDSSKLTVTASFINTEINNITSAMKLDLSPGTNSTADSGNPQNYTADVKYVDSLFSAKSTSRTLKVASDAPLNTENYAALDGSADTALDFPDSCFYSSISQSIIVLI